MCMSFARRVLPLLRLLLAAVVAFAFAMASCREADLIDLTWDDSGLKWDDDEQARRPAAPKKRARRAPAADADDIIIIDDAAQPPSKPKPAKVELPPWQGKQGTKRVLSEFRDLVKACAAGTAPCYDLCMPQEAQVNVWRFKLKDFDNDSPGGRALNSDLKRLHAQHGVDHLVRASLPDGHILSRRRLQAQQHACWCCVLGHLFFDNALSSPLSSCARSSSRAATRRSRSCCAWCTLAAAGTPAT